MRNTNSKSPKILLALVLFSVNLHKKQNLKISDPIPRSWDSIQKLTRHNGTRRGKSSRKDGAMIDSRLLATLQGQWGRQSHYWDVSATMARRQPSNADGLPAELPPHCLRGRAEARDTRLSRCCSPNGTEAAALRVRFFCGATTFSQIAKTKENRNNTFHVVYSSRPITPVQLFPLSEPNTIITARSDLKELSHFIMGFELR